ncbi:ABC transporter substrate-binding protein [Mesorhizobium sp. BAC0120]|uniref:ABC transporter substrate-binding protein n=1 Tax=Mesorhizobium sp. BAC0120 TaxID=3090670 RepID=UPI00298C1530|nr:ABC transporter substrate-binding protein [Mesorhizobium sp. BAC0120]MDW6022720.1 ABC transporter substrate-binding protein [Mesorhizobium sp. BAC0120]
MPTTKRPISGLIVALLSLPVSAALAVEADRATTAFVNRINAVIAPVAPGDREAIRTACAILVKQAFDIDAMAPSIAEEAWPHMSGNQRTAYSRGLTKRAVSDCTSHGNEIAGNIVEIVGVRVGESGDRLVAVRQSKGAGRTVIWEVHRSAGGMLKAVDMTVDGRSLAASARRDAKEVLKRTDGDVAALIRSVGG